MSLQNHNEEMFEQIDMGFERFRKTYQKLKVCEVRKIFDLGYVVVLSSEHDHPGDNEDKLHCIVKYSSRMFETEDEAVSHSEEILSLMCVEQITASRIVK